MNKATKSTAIIYNTFLRGLLLSWDEPKKSVTELNTSTFLSLFDSILYCDINDSTEQIYICRRVILFPVVRELSQSGVHGVHRLSALERVEVELLIRRENA